MSIRIAVHDNDEGDKTVNLLTKRSQGQYRRQRRLRYIRGQKETQLNKYHKNKGEAKLHEDNNSIMSNYIQASKEESSVRADHIMRIVEVFGFGGNPLHVADTVGRALGQAGFHATIRPNAAKTAATVEGKYKGNILPMIDIEVYPEKKLIYFRHWRGTQRTDKHHELEHAFRLVVHNAPEDFRLLPNYKIIHSKVHSVTEDPISVVIRETRNRMWVSEAASHEILARVSRQFHGNEPEMSARERFNIHRGVSQGEPKTYTAFTEPEVDMRSSTRSSSPPPHTPHGAAEWTDAEGNPLMAGSSRSIDVDQMRSVGDTGHLRTVYGSAEREEAERQHAERERFRVPRRGTMTSFLSTDPVVNPYLDPYGRDPYAMMQQGHERDSREHVSQRGPEVYSTIGREGDSPLIGGRRPPSFGEPKQHTVVIEPEMDLYPRPGHHDPSLITPDPEDTTSRRIPDSQNMHRHMIGQVWGVDHAAVQMVAHNLQGLGPITIHAVKDGVYVATSDGTTSIKLTLGGRNPKGYRDGKVIFERVNLHHLPRFVHLLPHIILKGADRPNKSFPIAWMNNFKLLVDDLSRHATPEQFTSFAAVLKHLVTDRNFKNIIQTGPLNAAMHAVNKRYRKT